MPKGNVTVLATSLGSVEATRRIGRVLPLAMLLVIAVSFLLTSGLRAQEGSAPHPIVELQDSLVNDVNGDGQAGPGDTVRYTAVLTNPLPAGASAQNVSVTCPVDPNSKLVVGSVTTTSGTVALGNTAGDTSVQVLIDALFIEGEVDITFDVVVNDPLAAGITQLSVQGQLTADNLDPNAPVPSDDPDTPAPLDPTITPLVAPVLPVGPDPIAAVPTLGSWGLLLLIAALFVAGTWQLRRRGTA